MCVFLQFAQNWPRPQEKSGLLSALTQWVARTLKAHQKTIPNILPSRNRPSGFNERGENKQGADKGAAARKTANEFCAVCAIYITLDGDGGRASHRERGVRYRAACKKQSPGALSLLMIAAALYDAGIFHSLTTCHRRSRQKVRGEIASFQRDRCRKSTFNRQIYAERDTALNFFAVRMEGENADG